ncbi:PstS family phosphate ABC transporter substrate-binding protein [Paenibacillus sp. sgz500958]|uniref:PstS family phosphate ABC transporter substrate-binding protein n=1 Tax=Paenibacillus sp. sgz500958 TaxID=3242475 RepID=UPI0036D369A9
MKNSFWLKLLVSLFLAAGIGIIGFVIFIMTSLIGETRFYAPLVLVITAGIAVYAFLNIFSLLSPRVRHIAMLSFIGLCVLATAGYEMNKANINSFAVVDEKEINLSDYTAFKSGSKVAVLAEPSSYRITGELPRLDGATALYPLYSAFVQAVYPAGEYNYYEFKDSKVVCSTTSEAYKKLIRGQTDIIFAAAPSKAQKELAELNGVELKLTPIGREAFVFFVNARNPVTGLTTTQIKDIYSGKITNWKSVGGKKDNIRAFQRREDSGSQTMLEKLMGDIPLMTPPQEDIADAMSGMITLTSSYRNYKNALGYSFLYYATEMNASGDIALLDIDGVKPGKDSIRSGEYPFAAEFYAVTAGSSNPNVQPFLDWMISSQGQELVEKTGYTSLN